MANGETSNSDPDRSIGSIDLLKALGVGALIGGAMAVFGHLQDPAHVVFTTDGLQKVASLFISGASGGALSFLVGQNSGFKKGYLIVPPRPAGVRTRATDVTVVETTTTVSPSPPPPPPKE